MFRVYLTVLFVVVSLAGCGPEAEPVELEEEEPREPRDYDGEIGGDRPVAPNFPDDYDVRGNHPLVIQLHGFGGNAWHIEYFLGLADEAAERGVVTLIPEGTTGSSGDQFWNATETCCDFDRSGVDDVAYISGLIEEAVEKYAVDPDRVFLMGLSNGAIMSHRMACDRGDLIKGIVSFNGSSHVEAEDCDPEHPVEIYQVHGTEDSIVPYDGATWFPSVDEVIERWVGWNGCTDEPVEGPTVDVTGAVSGDETTIEIWDDCDDGGRVELWTMEGAEHVPSPLTDFPTLIFDALLQE